MLLEVPYNRQNAVTYAKKWALSRNPLFFDFSGQGGNCTNFVSQCLLAGCGVTNDTETFGWYYRSPEDRAPAWTGVEALFSFLTGAPALAEANGGAGPYGTVATEPSQVALGDVIQLADESGDFYHSLLISGFTADDILICAQSDDALDRPLSSYNYASLRILHLLGARLPFPYEEGFMQLLEGTRIPT